MKVNFDCHLGFDLVPETYQDKVILYLFAKGCEDNNSEGHNDYVELSFSKGGARGFTRAKDVDTYLLDDEQGKKVCDQYITIDDITSLEVNAWPM